MGRAEYERRVTGLPSSSIALGRGPVDVHGRHIAVRGGMRWPSAMVGFPNERHRTRVRVVSARTPGGHHAQSRRNVSSAPSGSLPILSNAQEAARRSASVAPGRSTQNRASHRIAARSKRSGSACPDRHADREGVTEIDARQFGGCGADEQEVAGGERALESSVWAALPRDEHMFAR